ncbi:SDR family NAD(P)-dependent oxidoreductase [Sphingomonas lacunae]|uniref:SDR family NAD(P)-dependent oxidoreductase n=1 Tax=Sphingomonas lacunae TaxID=2698828 RepID=A0A6M4AW24_9SPHN|nr:SDR family NAD(P)-dependent oxidoreductase [Sphingomonas lacunae]QJQ33284.1 SDR family NAD(P)-dependent oxidoreductase [Sphingomonas lacunae]
MTDNRQSDQWAAGRIAFVTGATSGFGAAFARRIARAGGKVIATGRRVERLESLAAEFSPGSVLIRPLDLGDTSAIKGVVEELPEAFAAIDLLFNNAGLALGLGKAPDASLADWDEMIATNIRALVHVTHAILPGMVARNRGHIVNLSSVAASYPYPGGNVYGATKAFVRQFSLNLRADLLGSAVKVSSVEPGMCETEFSQVRFKGDNKAAEAVYAGMRPLSADDVTDAVEALLRLPDHLNVNTIELMPVQQAFSPFAVSRDS